MVAISVNKIIKFGFGFLLTASVAHATFTENIAALSKKSTSVGKTKIDENASLASHTQIATLTMADSKRGNRTYSRIGITSVRSSEDSRLVVLNIPFLALNNNGGFRRSNAARHRVVLGRSILRPIISEIAYVSDEEPDKVRHSGLTGMLSTNGSIVLRRGQTANFGIGNNPLAFTPPAYMDDTTSSQYSTFVTINPGQSHSFNWANNGTPWFSLTINYANRQNLSGTTSSTSIDPTIFEEVPIGMTETADQVFGSFGSRTQFLLASASHSTIQPRKYRGVTNNSAIRRPSNVSKWVSGFGGGSWHSAPATKVNFFTAQIGVVAGIDWTQGPNHTFGFAAGSATGTFASNATFVDSHNVETFSGFGGVYGASKLGQVVFDYGFLGGMQRHNSKRVFINSAVVGGIDNGNSSYNSYYFAPRVSLRRSYKFGKDLTLTSSGSLGIIAGRASGYTEITTGSTATFGSRNFSLGVIKSNITLAKKIGATSIIGLLGVSSHTGTGNEALSGNLLGAGWAYTTANGNGLTGQVGLALKHRFNPKMNGTIAADMSVSGTERTNIKGSANLRIEF